MNIYHLIHGIKKQKKRLLLSGGCLFGVAILGYIWQSHRHTQATIQESTARDGAAAIYTLLQGDVTSKKEVLERFCQAMTTPAVINGFIDKTHGSTMYYAPKNSLFLAVLCAPFLEETVFVQPAILKEQFAGGHEGNPWDTLLPGTMITGEECDPKAKNDMRKCDLSALFQKLFSAAMNDHATLSMAGWVLGNDKESAISSFSATYFGNMNGLCGGTQTSFLGKDSPSSEKEAICSHPKTYALLKQTIENLDAQRAKIQILLPEKLPESALCPGEQAKGNSQGTADDKENLFACSYGKGHTDANKQQANQTNLWYNELFYYRLLIARTSEKLSDGSSISDIDRTKETIDTQTQGASKEIKNLARELSLSQQALVTMQKSLDGFRATFPLHIGLYAYYEDVLALRKSLAKLYTPLHQLYYTLRNIQKKQ